MLWAPQAGPQTALVHCPLPEIFFGGARGGGKTDGVLGKWAIKERRHGEHFNAVMFRRTTVSAEDAIERARQIFCPLGAKFIGSGTPRFRMPNGGRVSFAYLENVTDADEYQGRNVTDAWVEEAGQYPEPTPIDRLNGVLRSAAGVPTQLILTANPGGAGQGWLRDRYKLHPFPDKPRILTRELDDGSVWRYAVIPSRISDNKILLDSDPEYLKRLRLVGGTQLVRAWLEGDWSAIEGAFFDGWSEQRNVISPFELPSDWLRFTALDWGYARPSSIGWYAVVGDDCQPVGSRIVLPRGCLVKYRELYTAAKPNVGMRLEAEEVASRMKALEQEGEKISYRVADPAIFATQSGPSIAERMACRGVVQRPADNARIGKSGSMGGWDQMRARLKGEAEDRPMLVMFKTCEASIRTIPMLQHDVGRPEDLDTEAEDHAADETRYACMSRPFVPREEYRAKPKEDFVVGVESTGAIKANMDVRELVRMKERLAKVRKPQGLRL